MSSDPSSEIRQAELPLPFPELAKDLPLLPARMLNEYQYCPRLSYLEWVQGEWAESADTVEGSMFTVASIDLLAICHRPRRLIPQRNCTHGRSCYRATGLA